MPHYLPSLLMIVRLLLLLCIAWIAWRLFRYVQRGALQRRPPPEQFEPMAPCSRCGTYLPAKALTSDGRCGRCSE